MCANRPVETESRMGQLGAVESPVLALPRGLGETPDSKMNKRVHEGNKSTNAESLSRPVRA